MILKTCSLPRRHATAHMTQHVTHATAERRPHCRRVVDLPPLPLQAGRPTGRDRADVEPQAAQEPPARVVSLAAAAPGPETRPSVRPTDCSADRTYHRRTTAVPPYHHRTTAVPPHTMPIPRLSLVALLCLLEMTALGWAAATESCDSAPPVPRVDAQGLVDQMTELAKLSDDPNPAVTRVLFQEHDMKARKFVKGLMSDVGLTIREDPMGNIFGRWEGSDSFAGSILTGSHCDAIPLAGMYDGVLGVLGGIEALAALKRVGFKPKKPLEVMMFTSEEPTRFGLGCIGSRGMAGVLTAADLYQKLDVNGSNFHQAAKEAGYGGAGGMEAMLEATLVPEGAVSHFVELHIEQGPLLEQDGINLGLVTAIAAPATIRMRFLGNGGHAGALLMPYRRDAGLAAAEVALAVEKAALRTGVNDTVATTGLVQILPGAVNSVPRDALLEIDVRDIDLDRRDSVVQEILDAAAEINARRGTDMEYDILNADPPATCASDILQAAEESAKQIGASYYKMVSRAYHDSLFMASIAPTAMIFIPCRGGVSHRPDEFSSVEDIGRGVQALALTMARLSAPGSCHNEL